MMQKLQTQKQPVCKKKKSAKKNVAVDKSNEIPKFRFKQILGQVLINPTTWRWVMVNLPDFIEKSEFFIKRVITFFTDIDF